MLTLIRDTIRIEEVAGFLLLQMFIEVYAVDIAPLAVEITTHLVPSVTTAQSCLALALRVVLGLECLV